MMKLFKFVPIQLTLFLILGIILGFGLNEISLPFVFILLLIGIAFIAITHFYSSFFKSFAAIIFQVLVAICMVLIGISSVFIHTETNYKKHYSNATKFSENTSNAVVLKIHKELKSTKTFDKYEAVLLLFNGENLKGKLLLNVKKDSVTEKLKVDDEIALKSTFVAIQKAMNPFGFDYRQYLNNQQIYHQLYVDTNSIFKFQNYSTTIYGITAVMRREINAGLNKNDFQKDELAVVNALLLGQRQFISEDLLNSYIDAGAIHILAVSGLHIGIILLFLNFLFKPLHSFKNGKWIAAILVLLSLWFYAVLAGLSASVVRAVTMFTALSIGLFLNKRSNVYNTLFISMFFLLLFKPTFLFDVGFQLSYLAVFSIVWIQPKLYNSIKVKWWVFDKMWQLLTVSLAAQLGVLPLSLFYFHQFPGLFFVANLAIIPFLGIILVGGIILMILSITQFLNPFLAEVYGYLISGMNYIISWTSSFKMFVIEDIYMSGLLMLAIYGFMVCILMWAENFKRERFVLLCFSVLLLQSVVIFEKYKRQTTNEFIVFNDYKNSVIGIRVGETIGATVLENNKVLKNYCIGNSLESNKIISPNETIFNFGNETILVVDSLGIYNVKSIKPSIVIVQNSPKINMDRLIKTLQPKMIVATVSNKKYYTKIWEQSCIKNKTPFYNVMQKGAFMLKD